MIRGPDFSKDIPAGVVRTIMHKADLDESGYLEYPEFIAMVRFLRILEIIYIFFLSYFASKIFSRFIIIDSLSIFFLYSDP